MKDRKRNENGYGRARDHKVCFRLSNKELDELQEILNGRTRKWGLSDLIRTLIHDEFVFGRHRDS